MTDTPVESDYQEFLAEKRDTDIRSHERAMRGTKVKIAKIEAKAKVKEAQARNSDFLVLKGFVAGCAVIAVLIVSVTYWAVQPDDPVDQKNKKDKYELCMSVEQDYDKCKYADG